MHVRSPDGEGAGDHAGIVIPVVGKDHDVEAPEQVRERRLVEPGADPVDLGVAFEFGEEAGHLLMVGPGDALAIGLDDEAETV